MSKYIDWSTIQIITAMFAVRHLPKVVGISRKTVPRIMNNKVSTLCSMHMSSSARKGDHPNVAANTSVDLSDYPHTKFPSILNFGKQGH
jgi:hypothetical protein